MPSTGACRALVKDALRRGDYKVVVGGHEEKTYSNVRRHLVFTPDSKGVAYVVDGNCEEISDFNEQCDFPLLVIGGTEYDERKKTIDSSSLLFTPDGTLLFRASVVDDKPDILIVSGKKGIILRGKYDPKSFRVSPDGSLISYGTLLEPDTGNVLQSAWELWRIVEKIR